MWLFSLTFHPQGIPIWIRLSLIVSSLWLLISGIFLLIRCKSAYARKEKFVIVFNIAYFISLFVLAIAIPHFVKARATSSNNACINNLRQIDAAANQFALEHHLTNGAAINFPNDLIPYIKLNRAGSIPPCPAGGVYRISKVGETPTCSLSNNTTPAHALLP